MAGHFRRYFLKFKGKFKSGGIKEIISWMSSYIKYLVQDNWLKSYPFRLRLYTQLLNNPTVHVIGDSHVLTFQYTLPFCVHHIGAPTAHNLKEKKSSTRSNSSLLSILKANDKKKSLFLLSFGEVDSRIHIYNQFMNKGQRQTLESLIETTIKRYIEAILDLVKQDYRIIIYGIPPANTQKNIYKAKHSAEKKTRSFIYRQFNDVLKRYCGKFNIPFINIYSYTKDKNGYVKSEYLKDELHLN